MGTALYRDTSIGNALDEALDELVESGQLPPHLAGQIFEEFDRAVTRNLEGKVTAKAIFKGALDTYRYCDNVWEFVLRDAGIRLFPTAGSSRREEAELQADQLRLVLVDSKVVNTAEGAA